MKKQEEKQMNMRYGITMCLVLVLLSATFSGVLAEDFWDNTQVYEAFENAYAYQAMPDSEYLPWIPEAEEAPTKPYDSVTAANLQGRWVHRHVEQGVSFEEILSVNGDTARIEQYEDGERSTVWNGEGAFYIEDRSYRGVCPALSILEESDEGYLQHCLICIRWVQENTFFDGLALNEWVREEPEDPWDQYLYDTVTLDNLQGVWYSEYLDGAGWYQDVLTVDGDRATLFETVNGQPSAVWNGEGPASVVMVEHDVNRSFPELIVRLESGPGAEATAGIAITRVDEWGFYDALFDRWFVRIWPEEEWPDED